MLTEKQIAELVGLIKKVEKLEAQLKQLKAQVHNLDKGQPVSVGPNVPIDG